MWSHGGEGGWGRLEGGCRVEGVQVGGGCRVKGVPGNGRRNGAGVVGGGDGRRRTVMGR